MRGCGRFREPADRARAAGSNARPLPIVNNVAQYILRGCRHRRSRHTPKASRGQLVERAEAPRPRRGRDQRLDQRWRRHRRRFGRRRYPSSGRPGHRPHRFGLTRRSKVSASTSRDRAPLPSGSSPSCARAGDVAAWSVADFRAASAVTSISACSSLGDPLLVGLGPSSVRSVKLSIPTASS